MAKHDEESDLDQVVHDPADLLARRVSGDHRQVIALEFDVRVPAATEPVGEQYLGGRQYLVRGRSAVSAISLRRHQPYAGGYPERHCGIDR
ncbi:hypothetical protein DMC63_37930 [Streptomyces sp. WAC 05977]|nr:hypothetical protein DMC63_37930 [Streptomyces sp. WAC 05977]